MAFQDQISLYDILEIGPDATPQEIREAYLRSKAAYNKDSIALYTLITPDEREATLHQIEEAYDTLSNADRRKEYDRSHGLLSTEGQQIESGPARAPAHRKIIS